ncbi:8675_t:CDS:10 [Acaulospora morrowiae]|uniref:8675_t:CDS:1 n=1 Tax=Acaulospora morrowiae TaxID=94023 RepID=A0A9N9E508_9GLOM|nr:8675_t:CDS:10 [Acaulospora morrowiae]
MPKRKQVFNNRGDNEVFKDEWEDVVLAPKVELLQHVGINMDELPKKVYEFVKLSPHDIKLLNEKYEFFGYRDGRAFLPPPRDPATIMLFNKEPFQVSQYTSYPIHAKVTEKVGYILNVGISVWALEWVPRVSSENDQYLAIAGYKSNVNEHHPIGRKQKSDMSNSIQLWKTDCRIDDFSTGGYAEPRLDMIICHDYGCVFDMQWCPYGANDDEDLVTTDEDQVQGQKISIPKLGILAVCFGNGSIGLFAIPKPDSVRRHFGIRSDLADPIFVKFKEPIYELSLPQGMCWTVSWGGHTKISTGCTNGDIATWNIFEILTQKFTNDVFNNLEGLSISRFEFSYFLTLHASFHLKLLSLNLVSNSSKEFYPFTIQLTNPINYFRAHDSCIRQIVWNSPVNPSHTLSCGHDGRLQIIDDRDPMFKNMFQRIRAFMMSACWPCHYGGIAYADSDNTVRYIRMEDLKKTTGLIMHHANVWRIAASYYHPFMASCSADGSVKIANICRLRDRHQKPIQVTLYRMYFDEDKVTICYQHNIKSKETTITYHVPESFGHFYRPEVSIQRLTWNPNISAGTWLASGGSFGLVRVESVHHD